MGETHMRGLSGFYSGGGIIVSLGHLLPEFLDTNFTIEEVGKKAKLNAPVVFLLLLFIGNFAFMLAKMISPISSIMVNTVISFCSVFGGVWLILQKGSYKLGEALGVLMFVAGVIGFLVGVGLFFSPFLFF